MGNKITCCWSKHDHRGHGRGHNYNRRHPEEFYELREQVPDQHVVALQANSSSNLPHISEREDPEGKSKETPNPS